MDAPKVIDSLSRFMRALTWHRIGMLSVLIVLGSICIIGWFGREAIIGLAIPAKISPEKQELFVSDSGKAAINKILTTTGGTIIAVGVVSMYLERNTRRIIYFKSTDQEFQRQQDKFVATHFTPDVPVFNDDTANNKRVIGYINGEFICSDFKDTQTSRYTSDIDVKFVCATAIPPLYGKFRGIVVAYLKGIPDAEEQTRLKILLRELAHQLDNPSSSK